MTSQRRRPEDLAGRWLTRFFIDHLAGERAASPRTVASYRDAIKLLLIWFKDVERIPPEKLRLADIDRPRVLRFLDWLEVERGSQAATRNQRLAVIKSLCRYVAVEQPGHLDQVTRDLLGHANVSTTEIYARADAETRRKAIENAYEPLTPDALPDWTTDPSLISWLDSLAR